jgi:hypothetical protein
MGALFQDRLADLTVGHNIILTLIPNSSAPNEESSRQPAMNYRQYLKSESVIIPVLRAVARRRLVETGSTSACATVVCKWYN